MTAAAEAGSPVRVTQPVGGFEQSGRDGGVEGIAAYLETKTIQGL